MNTKITVYSALMAVLVSACNQAPDTTQAEAEAQTIKPNTQTIAAEELNTHAYPVTKTINHTDDYNGVAIEDPYRWLEELDSENTRQWIDDQNKVTFAFLEGIPGRDKLRERLTSLWNYEKYTIPYKEGGRYFYRRNDGLQNQSVIYTLDELDGEPRMLLDPNTLSEDGTVSVAGTSTSPDGKYLAYSTSTGGSDWREWFVRDVETGKDMDDHVQWSKFSGASWAADSSGFYYSAYDAPEGEDQLKAVNYYQKLYFHKLGTPQSEDQLVYQRPDQKEWGFGGGVSDDGRYLIIPVWQGTDPRNRFFYQDLQSGSEVVELISELESSYQFIGNDGPLFYFLTNNNADNYRVIGIDTNNPERENWKEIIAERQQTIRNANHVGGHLVVSYLKDAHSQVVVFNTQGEQVREVELPGIGSAGGFFGKAGETETFYSFTGFTTPSTIFRYDIATGETSMFKAPDVQFEPSDFVTEQVFYESKDGTRVPMFIMHKRGLERTANNPTILYGYGGFNIPLTPGFSVERLAWMEMGGVFAIANLRGGGEYGKQWHLAGTKTNKQNVFDDFIAAAEWLIENNYTSSSKLAISGRSNGGLLVGASMTQRPDLFAVALPGVGVMDMLRFNKFTIGWAWESDYGSPQNPEEFAAIRAYSPLHNLKPGTRYPATLVTTADHDDRVFPAHSFKFAAALQQAHEGNNPVMIRVETKAGHGAGKPTSMRIEEIVDNLAFVAANTDTGIKIE